MSGETPEELVQKLVDSFRTLLDEALIVAIANDHDLQQDLEFDTARSTLEGLARDVASEEASGFNPSGIFGPPNEPNNGPSDDASATETSNSHQGSRSRDTDASSSDQASSTTESTYSMPQLTSFNGDSDESNIIQLQGIFTDLKEYDIKYSYKKANGDFQAALDDLLNVQYLKSTGQEMKGIDGFFKPDEEVRRKKKGKKSKTGRLSTSDIPTRDPVVLTDPEKEMKRQDEIVYLSDRLELPFAEVSEIYYRKRCSSGATAVQILDQYIDLGIETTNEAGKKKAQELAKKHRNVPEKYMPTLVQVAGTAPAWCEEIAALLSQHFTKNPWSQKLDVAYNLKPLPQEDIEGFETMSYGKAAPKRSLAIRPGQSSDPATYAQAAEIANRHNQAKREAAASAASLHRRGTSSPLYRQAAAYYSELAREQGRYAHTASSTAADLLVGQQSSANSIDLHGVYVQDGVRIAREKVQAWWSGLGEFKSQKARQQPFKVITGLGRHSAGGVSQLRQAVSRALLQDGWALQVETGRFIVKGRR
ncbi:Fc.00g113260.m01.CDS01 [Cosmosporella sp. VM-42]